MPAEPEVVPDDPVRGHEGELYEAHARRLLRIVAHHVRTTPENIEDACHFAWTDLLSHADRVGCLRELYLTSK